MSNKKEEEKKVEFKGQWTKTEKTGLDYSRNLEKQYKEVPPYAKDEKGKFINNSSKPILVESEPFNVDEYIQSFKDDCDIYKILEKAYLSNNIGLLNVNTGGQYVDISDLPDNPYEMENISKDVAEAMANYTPSVEDNMDENKEENKEEKEVKQ